MQPSHSIVRARDAQPSRLLLFLHGILGQGHNWRGVARRLVEARPEWGAVLVDLRAHGDSRDIPPPDSVDAAARDLHALMAALDPPVRAVLGHSFGGKVALKLVGQLGPGALGRAFIVDSLPSASPERRGSEGTIRVVDMLAALPGAFPDRDAFAARVVGAGFSPELAGWLAQSLDRTDEGYVFGLDVRRIRALLDDYFREDLFGVLDPPPEGLEAHFIVGGRSSVWSDRDLERGSSLARAYPDRVSMHVLERADHWVHVDDPDGLLAIVLEALP